MRLLLGYVQTGELGFPLAQRLTVTRHKAWPSFRPYFYPTLLQTYLLLASSPRFVSSVPLSSTAKAQSPVVLTG